MPSYGHIRASDADRDRAIDVLKAGFAEGRLSKEEFAERQDRVLAARTYRDLAAVTADLPVGPFAGRPAPFPPFFPPLPPAYPVPPRVNPLAIASVVAAFIPLFGCIPAIVLGHTALKEIRTSGERGSGLAAFGLSLGYFTVGFFVLIAMFLVAR